VTAARAALLLVAGLALAAPFATLAAAAEPGEDGVRIGRYRLTRAGDAVEIALPADGRVGRVIGIGGVALALVGAGLVASRRVGLGGGLVVLGLGIAALGALGVFGTTTVRASRAELVREGLGGRSERWPRATLEAIEVARRAPSAEDQKRVGMPRWDVRVRGQGGAPLPVRFTLGSEAEARTLAVALANALGLPPPGR
jgi:hypothetical protein